MRGINMLIFSCIVTISCACNNSSKEQEERTASETQILREQKNSELAAMIIRNIDRQVRLSLNRQSRLLGGYKNMTLFAQNKTDYDIENLQVRVLITRSNGDVADEQTVIFDHIEKGRTNSQPLQNVDVGSHIDLYYESINIPSLETGDIKINGKLRVE